MSAADRYHARPTSETVPNLAPMVDVIMVLLVFFLLGASLALEKEGVLMTELDPRSGPGEGASVEIIPVVKIALADVDAGAAVAIYVAGQRLEGGTFGHLQRYLMDRKEAGADPLNPVVIAAESTVRWKFVVSAMDAAVRAGFENVQFAVSLSPTPAGGP